MVALFLLSSLHINVHCFLIIARKGLYGNMSRREKSKWWHWLRIIRRYSSASDLVEQDFALSIMRTIYVNIFSFALRLRHTASWTSCIWAHTQNSFITIFVRHAWSETDMDWTNPWAGLSRVWFLRYLVGWVVLVLSFCARNWRHNWVISECNCFVATGQWFTRIPHMSFVQYCGRIFNITSMSVVLIVRWPRRMLPPGESR